MHLSGIGEMGGEEQYIVWEMSLSGQQIAPCYQNFPFSS